MSGCFFTFEGGEGAGKSTQINLLGQFLKQKGYDVVVTREPGGTEGGEAIRHVLLSGSAFKAGKLFEATLFAAARIDHVNEVIEPALKEGYLEILEKSAIHGHMPDITFILDLPAKAGMERANKRRGKAVKVDRFEKDALAVQEARRQAFLKIAEAEPQRCYVIDATRDINDIAKKIENITLLFLDRKKDAST